MAESSGGWDVTNQVETLGQGPGNRYVRGMEVTITTKAGHSGSVFIPYEQYAPERAKPLLASLAARLDAVANLKG